MQFAKLELAPGINRETTDYTNMGGWFDCDKIRFRNGKPEKIGGWTQHTTQTFRDVARALWVFVSLSGTIYIAIGSTKILYLVDGGELFDITPFRKTSNLNNPIDTVNGSTTVTVNDTAHGAVTGDLALISGSTAVGGIPAGEINALQEVTSYTANSWTFEVATAATSTVSGGGGASVQVDYYIPAGLDSVVFGDGWGTGGWGEGGWGDPSDTSGVSLSLRVWSLANYGEDLIANPRDGGIYYWDKTGGTGARAVDIDTLAGASDAPDIATKVIVSDRDRHVIAFGCDSITNPGTQDKMLIRWSDQESAADWTPTTINTSGSILLSYGSEIITALQTRQEILVWTDKALYAMRYIGGLYTFAVQPVSDKLSIIGYNAMTSIGDRVFWMGIDSFYMYDGQSRYIPCSLEDYVFSDLNFEQRDKVYASTNADDQEIIWFYPSAGSSENDRYIIFNYGEGIWYHGTMARTAWLDAGPLIYPLAASTDGYLYEHENGITDGSTNPPSRISSFIESSPVEIANGEQFTFIKRMIPDITFNKSTDQRPDVKFVIKAINAPGAGVLDSNGARVTKTSSTTVENFDQEKWLRLRGRSFVMRVEDEDTNKPGVHWRLGVPRFEIRTDGRR